MPNVYLISSTFSGDRPETGGDPSLVINENMSLLQAVGALVTQVNRQHHKPGTIDKLIIVGDSKKGHMIIGNGLTVSNVKTLAPIAPFLTPGRDRIGVEMIGFKISGEVANRDLAEGVAKTLQTGVRADKEEFFAKKT